MPLSVILAGIATGLVLGIFGSGGAIITTPALLYLLHVPPKSAIAMSLGVIAITASLTALQHWRHGNVSLKVTAVFSLFSVIGTYVGARIGIMTPVVVQLSIFALVMYAAAWRMLKPSRQPKSVGAAVVVHELFDSPRGIAKIVVIGIVVGALAGLVGVGGGFLIVPALALLSGLPMKQAIGTSLAIVSLNSISGFAGYMGEVPIDYSLVGLFATVAVIGSIFGTRIAHRLSPEHLKRAFALFLLFVATDILFKSVL